MSAWQDSASAQAIRDLVVRIVRDMLNTERPVPRYATVVTLDRANRKATVTYIGETSTVTVGMGSIQPLAVGQVVRIGGLPGDKYIEDVLGDSNFGWKPGDIKMYAGAATGVTPQAGWLVCDGTAVSRTTYADLFAAIGTKYGAGDGVNTFNLPGGTGNQVPIGIAITANTRATAVASGVQSADHTHTGTSGIESQGHTHTITLNTESVAHSHTVSGNTATNTGTHTHGYSDAHPNTGNVTDSKTTNNNSAGHTHTVSGNTGNPSATHNHTLSAMGTPNLNHTHTTTTGIQSASHTHDVAALSVTYLIKY